MKKQEGVLEVEKQIDIKNNSSHCLFYYGKVSKYIKRLIANKGIKKVSNTCPPFSLNNYIPK